VHLLGQIGAGLNEAIPDPGEAIAWGADRKRRARLQLAVAKEVLLVKRDEVVGTGIPRGRKDCRVPEMPDKSLAAAESLVAGPGDDLDARSVQQDSHDSQQRRGFPAQDPLDLGDNLRTDQQADRTRFA